jgi:hypothetical protein
MRPTLDIDDDILLAARELARKDKVSAGQVLSRLARAGLSQAPGGTGPAARSRAARSALGIAVLPRRDELITNENDNRLRDELGV